MKQWLDEIPEKSPIYEADVKLLDEKICAKSNIQGACSSKHSQIEIDDEQIANTDVEHRCYALGSRRDGFFVNSLQEALRAVKLYKAKPAWDRPNAVIPSYFRNFSILAQTDQNFIDPNKKHYHWHQNQRYDDSRTIHVDTTHFRVPISKRPSDERLQRTVQTHCDGKDQHIEEHVAKTDTSEVVAAFLSNIENVKQLHHLEENHCGYHRCCTLCHKTKALRPCHVFCLGLIWPQGFQAQ